MDGETLNLKNSAYILLPEELLKANLEGIMFIPGDIYEQECERSTLNELTDDVLHFSGANLEGNMFIPGDTCEEECEQRTWNELTDAVLHFSEADFEGQMFIPGDICEQECEQSTWNELADAVLHFSEANLGGKYSFQVTSTNKYASKAPGMSLRTLFCTSWMQIWKGNVHSG